MDVALESIHNLELARAALLRQLQHIDSQLDAERAQYARLCNQNSPIHSLPNELLALLFGLTHTSLRSDRSAKADLHALKFLVDASRVCSRWRLVILHTPLLWNTIIMTVTSGFNTNTPAQEYLLAHLSRSGDAYLDMIFCLQTDDTKDLDLLFTTLGSHSHRWRRTSMEMRSANIRAIQQHLQSLPVPLLKHFSLNVFETSDTGPTSPRTRYPTILPQIFLHGAPALSVLRLANAALGHLHPNSTSIQTLHIGGWGQSYFTWTQFKTLLESLPYLENLSLHELCIRHNTKDPLDQPSPIQIQNLRSLRLHKPFTPLDRILPLLHLPGLQHISLHDVESFECPKIPTVTHIFLDDCPFDELQYELLFSTFPNLQDLTIDEYAYRLYDMLRPPPTAEGGSTPPCIWSSLHTLNVRELTPRNVNVFVNLVNERKQARVPIATVRLDRRSRAVLRLKHRWDQLAEHTSVVPCDAIEPWPPGLGYDDLQDLV